jgi:hypothetical protein
MCFLRGVIDVTRQSEFEQLAAPQHHWTKPEDIVAFFLSRFGDRSFLGIRPATIVRLLNERPVPDLSLPVPLTLGSLEYRIGNFNYLDRKPGLPDRKPLWCNYAQLSRDVYEEYKNASIVGLRSLAIQILGITVKDRDERAFQEFCKRFLEPTIPTK